MKTLYEDWIRAKGIERDAAELRRKAEDALSEAMSLGEDFEGSKSFDHEGYKVKVTGRMNRKIDADKLQDIAAECGLSQHLGDLFRWKPDINAAKWKNADDSITRPLLDAITTTPGRPSFSIVKEEA